MNSTHGFLFFLILSNFFLPLAQADVAGRVRLEDTQYFKKQANQVDQNLSGAVFEIETKNKLSDNWRFRFEPHLRASSDPKTMQSDLDGDLRDTQFEAKYGNYRIQIGSFIKAWEGTDGLNPMDLATVKNLRDPMNAENLGSFGITLSGGQGFFTWDALYVPRQTLTRLPGDSSAWWPRTDSLPLQRDNKKLIVPENPAFEVVSRDEINHALKDNGGLRMQFHGNSWDFSLAGYEGAAQTPYLQPIVEGDLVQSSPIYINKLYNPIRVRPIDYRRRSLAGLLVYTNESWIFRIAGRHDQPLTEIEYFPTWSDQFVGGFEKTITIRDQNVIFLLQGSFGRSPESGGLLSVQDLMQQAVLYGVRWPWSDVTTVTFAGFTETKHSSSYHRLSYQRKISDPSTIELSFDVFSGPSDTLLGIWADQNRGTLAYTYQF